MEYAEISKNRLKELAKLKQKKYRLQEGKVVIEGLRTIMQLKDYGISPLEQYVSMGEKVLWDDITVYQLKDWEIAQICESEHPQGVAALFHLPEPGRAEFRSALYLDGISDPGNLGTIFRIAAAFSIDHLFLSPDCVEVSSPKVIRASLGSVYKVPFETIDPAVIQELKAKITITDSHAGISLRDFIPDVKDKVLIVLGSEAHGVSSTIKEAADEVIRIEMSNGIESLNVSVAAGIIAHYLYTK